MTRLFKYVDADGNQVSCKANWFIEQAISEFIGYGDKTKLLIAKENGLPELWESEHCQYLTELLENGAEFKARGHKPSQNKRLRKRDGDIWERIHYLHGTGLAIWDGRGQAGTACSCAGAEHNISGDAAYKVYRKLGGPSPEKAYKLSALIAYAAGKAASDH